MARLDELSSLGSKWPFHHVASILREFSHKKNFDCLNGDIMALVMSEDHICSIGQSPQAQGLTSESSFSLPMPFHL